MTRTVIIILTLYLTSCIHKTNSIILCNNEKAFISLDKFIESQKRLNDSVPVFPTETLLPSFLFDSLKTFSQIDSLQAKICRQGKQPFGIIPLKYSFNNDTLLISAFPFACRYAPDIFANLIFVNLSDSVITFNFSNKEISLNDKSINDSLKQLLFSSFKPYLIELYREKVHLKDSNLFYKTAKDIRFKNKIVFVFELQNDKQLPKLKEPLDFILNSYIAILQESMKTYYKKEICELSTNELKLLSRNLLLTFEIKLKK